MTETDRKGFILSPASLSGGRQFVAVRAPELRALERSKDKSLRALAQRINVALIEGRLRKIERLERNRQLVQEMNRREATK